MANHAQRCAVLSVGEVGKYPYPDLRLSEAVTIVEKVYRDYGGKISASNLAKIFGIEPRGGGFRNRVEDLTAYDLIEGQREYRLTKLALRIIENPSDFEAKAQAFLKVSLFKAMHDEFKGKLPDDMSAFMLRLKDITKAEEKEVSIRAARLRNHYNEALPYLMPGIFPVSGESEVATKAVTEVAPRFQQQPTAALTIPADYAKLVTDNFIVGARKDLESMELLRKQVASWIDHWKIQLGKQKARPETTEISEK